MGSCLWTRWEVPTGEIALPEIVAFAYFELIQNSEAGVLG